MDKDVLFSKLQDNINRSLRIAEKKMETQLANAILTLGETISQTIQKALQQHIPQVQMINDNASTFNTI